MNQNIWYPAIPDYIDLAFTWAHEVDPNVKLFYNDWGDEGISTKSNAVFNYIQGMKSRGIPIHGVGFESHFGWNSYPPQSEVIQNMKRYGDLGIEVHVTEMDVSIGGDGVNKTRLEVQADIYGGMAQACLTAKGVCKNWEVWGFTDAHSWLESQEADLFTAQYEPRPAFWKVASVLGS